MKTTILISILLLCSCAHHPTTRITIGHTSDYAPGCTNDTAITKIDIEKSNEILIYGKWYYEKAGYITGYLTEGELYPGLGYRLRLKYAFTDALSAFAGGGLLGIYKGGNIDGLASSPLYGNLECGFKYKWFVLGVNHNSSPFHHADEGDSGVNDIFGGVSFEF